jgi:hypothetical protein
MYIILYFDFNSYTSIDSNRDNNELLLVIIEKKVEWYKIIELFKVRYKLIRLKILFSIRLLLSKAKL